MNTDTERRVNVMCNLSEALVERTVEKTNEDTIELLIMDYLEEGKSREQIIQKLIKVFKIDEDKASSYFEKYNKSVLV